MGKRIAVIGAGISGLACAERLKLLGHQVQVFEKSRGLGGRVATRRSDQWRFDHGAQYFTVRDPRFKKFIDLAVENHHVSEWEPRTCNFPKKEAWYVGQPNMVDLAKQFDRALSISLNTLVTAVKPGIQLKWLLEFRQNSNDKNAGHSIDTLNQVHAIQTQEFDLIIFAMPQTQVRALLLPFIDSYPEMDCSKQFQTLEAQLKQCEMQPCWTVMFTTFTRPTGCEWAYDVYSVKEHEIDPDAGISWLARNNSKPKRLREEGYDHWVVHTSPKWSESHLDSSKEAVIEALRPEFLEIIKLLPSDGTILQTDAHRWLYAKVLETRHKIRDTESKVLRSVYLAQLGIGICGDYLSSSRVENAFLSGFELAEQVNS